MAWSLLDEIEAEARTAAVLELAALRCAVPSCRRRGSSMVILKWTDGHTNAYVLCPSHERKLKARLKGVLGRRERRWEFHF